MSVYLGDFPVNASVYFQWNTNGQDGASITRSTDGTLKIYKDNSATERSSLNGVTQTEDFDAATGVHAVTIDLSDNTDAGFYAAGHEYSVVMTGMTIDTKTVNAVVAHFSIERAGGALALLKNATYGLAQLVRSATPANTLAVDADGCAKADLTKMVTVAQSATDLKDFADTGYDPATHKVQGVVLTDTATSLTNAVTLANGAHGGAAATITLSTPIVANVTQLGGVAQSATDLKDLVDAGYDPVTHKVASDAPSAAVIAGLVWDEGLAGHVGAGSAGKAVSDINTKTATLPAAPAGVGDAMTLTVGERGSIADQVWNEAIADHLGAGSTGAALNAAGGAGDPWGTPLPGAYGAGTAGKIVSDALTGHTPQTGDVGVNGAGLTAIGDARIGNLDVAVSTRLATLGYTAPDNASIAAILVDTGTDGVVVAAGSKTGYALTAAYDPAKTAAQAGDAMTLTAAYDAAKTAAQAGDAMTLTVAERGSVADKILGRSIQGGADGARTVTSALRALRNKTASAGGTLTVYQEDDATSAWTAALTTDAAADPIVTVDPA